jgi:hypothetical protein
MAGFSGVYSLNVQVSGTTVSFSLGLPGGSPNAPLTIPLSPPPLPPPTPGAVIAPLAHWLLNAAAAGVHNLEQKPAGAGIASAEAVFQKLIPLVENAFAGQQAGVASAVQPVVEAVWQNIVFNVGTPATISLKWPVLSASLDLANLSLGAQGSASICVGRLHADAGFDLTTGHPTSASFALHDVRLRYPAGDPRDTGSAKPDPTSLAGRLLPDLSTAPGFDVAIALDKSSHVQISGGGTIAVQKNLGPLNVGALHVSVDNAALHLGIDLSFELGPIQIAVHDFGVKITYQEPPGQPISPKVAPYLAGLGISLDASVVKLAGEFAEVTGPNNPAPDYVGAAMVSVIDLFQLTAIGGYTQASASPPGQPSDGKTYTSVFVFAALVAPLGGPPFFFVVGIAGGFGYNRTLPPPGQITDHPFLQVMDGRITFVAVHTPNLLYSPFVLLVYEPPASDP